MVEVRHGYFKRVGNAFVMSIIGILLFLGSFVLLAWNERDAVRQTGAITEIESIAIADVSADSIDSGNQDQLVHMASEAVTDDELEFPQFGIREKAIHLRWEASIYQWKERTEKKDDRTVYEYEKEWVDRPIDSSQFKESGHSNGDSTQHFQDGGVTAREVRFGAFRLTDRLVSQINNEERFTLPESVALDVRPQGRVSGGVFYTGDPNQPEIGDEKVEVYIIGPKHNATVMATQSGNTFKPYVTKVGIEKEILYLGKLTKSEVISKQRTEAAIKRWLLRGGGFLLMWVGLCFFFSPLRALVSFIPFANRLLEGAIGFVTFFIALALSMTTIAIAWLVVHPVLSISLLVVSGAAIFFAFKIRGKDSRSQSPPPTNAAPPPLPS